MLFSYFSKARKAVKRTSEVEFSYIELTIKKNARHTTCQAFLIIMRNTELTSVQHH